MRCYVDGEDCDCGAFDVANDCPRDPYVHEDDNDLDGMEDLLDREYHSKHRSDDNDEIFR